MPLRRYGGRRYKRRLGGRGAYYYKPSAMAMRAARRVMTGRGSYFGDLWRKYRRYLPRAIGGIGGMLAGNPAGGWNIGAQASKLLGWGAYRRARANRGTSIRGDVPSMHSTGENGVWITHKECIGVVESSTAFTVTKFEVNPGLNSVFPWLSGIANNFQQYDVKGLAFVYKPTCSDAISSATIAGMGSVTMTNDMNVLASTPTSTIGMLQTQFAVSGKPSASIMMPVEQDKRFGGKMTNHLLVRNGDVPAGGTKQLYDDCVVFIATEGNGADGVELGQLFVTYSICFYGPQNRVPGDEVVSAEFSATSCTDAKMFGDDPLTMITDSIGVTKTGVNEITLDVGNAGTYGMTVYVPDCDVQESVWLASPSITGGTLGTVNKTPVTAALANGGMMFALFTISDPTAQCVITLGGLNNDFTSSSGIIHYLISQVNPGVQ